MNMGDPDHIRTKVDIIVVATGSAVSVKVPGSGGVTRSPDFEKSASKPLNPAPSRPLMARADASLYRAKRNGRNRVDVDGQAPIPTGASWQPEASRFPDTM